MYHELREVSFYTNGEIRQPSDRKYHMPKPNNKSICELQNNKVSINL